MKLICNTFDGNNDIWSVWVNNWKYFAEESKADIVINNELLTDSKIGDVVWASDIRGEKKYPLDIWTDQLKDLLVVLRDDLVILAQDDYILEEWDLAAIQKAVLNMGRDDGLDCIHLSHQVKMGANNKLKFGRYFLNTQVAIWRRESLIEALSVSLNPWCWELRGQKLLKRPYRILYLGNEAVKYKALIKQGKVVPGKFNILEEDYIRLVEEKGLYNRPKIVGKIMSLIYFIKCLKSF